MLPVAVAPGAVPALQLRQRSAWIISVGCQQVRFCNLDIRTVDISTTTTDEQRSTDWMTFESLADFLDPADSTKTVEGCPAPKRAITIATRGTD